MLVAEKAGGLITYYKRDLQILTDKQDIEKYVGIVGKSVSKGDVILGTFSMDGPVKCSGLPVKQYDPSSI
jgi:hypothetical protein